MASYGFTKLFLISVLFVIIAVYFNKDLVSFYKQSSYNDLESEIPKILESLKKSEKKILGDSKLKVAVGFGGCMDIFVDAAAFFKEMQLEPTQKFEHHDSIGDSKDLVEGFLYYFTHGAAGERYVNNATLFRQMVDVAEKIPSSRKVVGGNAPVIANRLALEGADVLLASTGAEDFTSNLHKKIKLAGDVVDYSDIHLILEYKSHETWGAHRSPRANRYIAIADKYNPTISSLESFADVYEKFNADLYVVGGLQVMDNYNFKPGERMSRLSALSNLLHKVRLDKKPVHFEMASFVEESLLADVVKYILPHSDSLGMNEQELPNLISYLKHGEVTMVSEAYPRTAHVLDLMRQLYTEVTTKLKSGELTRPASRIHVHTLAFQAIMTRTASPWKNTMESAAHASLTANRHICGKTRIDIATSKMLMDESFSTTTDSAQADRIHFSSEKPVSCWNEEIAGDDVFVCVAPNLVCTKVFQTAGGGDNISGAGLRYQVL